MSDLFFFVEWVEYQERIGELMFGIGFLTVAEKNIPFKTMQAASMENRSSSTFHILTGKMF